ncbi:hypothetical protein GF339_14895 [candidate division KSB3 bacterium]|uniref:Uncharacterized protein n=1 Tax=candidate division KSB3 bacterium TaxID=2044937 RepID=A0A9D5JY67_9BACT|nr:hypothetical protein [candidate division KSB3 bacterium]MBD3325871.1 hypothetical protein [candidate division KSB3 bacterium]
MRITSSMIIGLMVCMVGWATPLVAQEAEEEVYTWEAFEFTYPSHWDIVIDEDVNEMRQVKLVANADEDVIVLLSLMPEFPDPDDAYWEMPAMASVSFGLGLALNLAGEHGEAAVALHYGSIELAYGPATSARFTVMKPDAEDVYALECFHFYAEEEEMAYFGMVVSKTWKGQTLDDPLYAEYAEEAFGIVRSLIIE